MQTELIAVCIGLLTGLLSGLMGIGGGAIGTPLLRLVLGVAPIVALATTMPVLFPSALSGAIAYYQKKLIDFRLAGAILVTAVPMTWIGASLSHDVSGQLLMVLTAVLLTLIGCSFLVRGYILREATDAPPRDSFPLALLWGSVGGLMAGLLAIGGGVIYVPVFLRVFRRPMKVSLATSLIVVVAVSIPGTLRHGQLGHIDWNLALYLSLGVLPTAYLGARLALRFRNRTLERLFGILTLLFGVYFYLSQN